MSQPIGTPSDGYSKILWLPGQSSITDPSAPTVAELTSMLVKDLSLYFTDFTPNLSEDTAATPRINTEFTPTRPGRAQRTIATAYVSNPQLPTHNVAELELSEHALGYYIERVGYPHAQPIQAGDIVNVYFVQLGRQNPSRAANTDWQVMQTAFVQAYWRSVEVIGS